MIELAFDDDTRLRPRRGTDVARFVGGTRLP